VIDWQPARIMGSKKTFRIWEAHRPAAGPGFKLPFRVEYAGHYRSKAGFRSSVKTIDFIQVFWCAAGEGIIVINGREQVLRAGQVALYFPRMEHRYYTAGKKWDVYWWTMQGSLAPSIAAAFGLGAEIYDAGPPPVRMFAQLARALRNPAPYGEAQASSIAFQLLVRIGHSQAKIKRQADPEISGIVATINAEWHKPALNVKQLAAASGMNRTALSHRFRKAVGISPGEYIARLRVQNAVSLLTGTRRPVEHIAASCGYLDRHYFARLLKKRMGASPARLRRKFSVGH